jgi:hypothetical protein
MPSWRGAQLKHGGKFTFTFTFTFTLVVEILLWILNSLIELSRLLTEYNAPTLSELEDSSRDPLGCDAMKMDAAWSSETLYGVTAHNTST